MRPTMVCVAVIASCIAGYPARAQDPTPLKVVRGVVYDSLSGAPLSNAVVQLVRADAAARGHAHAATTDSLGHYLVADVEPGRYAIGFQHPRAAALTVELPALAVGIEFDTTIVDLAIPSPSRLRALACGNAVEGSLFGTVLDARDNAPIDSTRVTVRWFELGIVKGKMVSAPVERSARSDDRGVFRICGIPAEGAVHVALEREGFRSLEGEITLDPALLWTRDVRLQPAGTLRGNATVSGTVLHDDSTRVTSGVVRIASLGIQAPIEEGTFVLREFPAGSAIATFTAVGHEPATLWIDAVDRSTSVVNVVLRRDAQKLEAVNVVGAPGRDLKVLREINERSRVASGTMFLPGNNWLEGAMIASDVLRAARGFMVKSQTVVEARPFVEGLGLHPCRSRASDARTDSTGRAKEVAIYLDGERWLGGLEQINDFIPAKDLLAVEAYPDVTSAPFLWRAKDACAVIAFWTKRGR